MGDNKSVAKGNESAHVNQLELWLLYEQLFIYKVKFCDGQSYSPSVCIRTFWFA